MKDLNRIALLILLLLLLLGAFFGGVRYAKPHSTVTTDTVYLDTNTYHVDLSNVTLTKDSVVYEYTDSTIYNYKDCTVVIYKIDTIDAIEDYFTFKSLDTTITFPNKIQLDFQATLWKNDFFWLDFNVKNTTPTVINKELPKRSVNAGIELGYNNLSATASYSHNKTIFRAGYNFIGKSQERIRFGVERKIFEF